MWMRFGLRRLGRRLFPRGHEGCRLDSGHTSPQHRCFSKEANVIESPFPCVDVPHVTLNEFVCENVDRWPNLTAIVCGKTGRNYTYRQLREKCRRFSVSLRHMGLEPGSIIAVIMPNIPDYPVVVLGALEAGLVVNIINDAYLPGEVSTMLLETSPRALVCLPVNYSAMVEAVRLAEAHGYKIPPIIVARSDSSCEVPDGAFSLEQMTGPNLALISMARVPVNPCAVAVLPFSSGTSGHPKAVALSHRNLVANIAQINDTPELVTQDPTTDKIQDVVAAVLPFSHIYGLQVTLLGRLRTGVKVVTLAKFTAHDYLNMLKRHRVTILPVAPAIVSFMASCPSEVLVDSVRSCRLIISGSAPISEQHAAQLMKVARRTFEFSQGYGLTETSPVLLLSPTPNNKLLSVGKLLPNTRAKVVDLESGRNLGPGEYGELCFQGPQIMTGYYSNTKATAEMIDKAGWLHTGDEGYYDECQDFLIVDRIKDLIKVKGLQVAPAELEECVRYHPEVSDVAVVGMPCPRMGEVPWAFVCPKDRSRLGCKVLGDSVKDYVKDKKAAHKHLSEVHVVPLIPKSVSGKVMRRKLKEIAKQKAADGDKKKLEKQ